MTVRPSTGSPSIDPAMSMVAYASSIEREVGVGEVGEAIAKPVDLIVDVVVADRLDRQLDAQLVVTDEVHLRAHLDDRLELDVAFFLTGGDLDLGRRDHVDVVLGDRVDVELGQRVAQRLLARGVGARAAPRAAGAAPCPDGIRARAPRGPACETPRRSPARTRRPGP